jgi:hypothetical protein
MTRSRLFEEEQAMFLLRSRRLRFAAVAIAFAASGCSGGSNALLPGFTAGRSPTTSNTWAVRAPFSPTNKPTGWATIRFRIPVPGRTLSDEPHRVFPQYVAATTSKVVAIVRGRGQKKASKETFPCTAVCTGAIVAPIGPDLITLRLEDATDELLSQGTATVLVFKKKHNSFNFTLDGVPRFVSLIPVPGVVPVTPASSGDIVFEALDADGNLITPDGDYTNAKGQALAFDVASSNPHVQLDVTTVSAPGTLIPYSYDGSQHVGTITLTPSLAPGVKAHIDFASSNLTLVPGIASRIPPPLPVQMLSVTQVPQPAGDADPNAIFLLGNAGGEAAALAFNVATGVYGIARSQGTNGAFGNPPIDLGGGTGFYGELSFGSNTYNPEFIMGAGDGISNGGFPDPCASDQSPIGKDASGTLFCEVFGSPGAVVNHTDSTFVAEGQIRLIRTINGTDYFVTVNEQSATPPGLQVYTSASYPNPIAGALCVGANVTSPATGYFGNSGGTVTEIGGSTVATFSNAVESVVGYNSTVYVYESGGIFGVSGPTGMFESQVLPIGAVVDVATGVNGAPMLVESDGTLDVMGI